MSNALTTGVSGLAAHQKMIEVVGHNLANMNTTAFKARRAQFADVFYETIKSGAGSSTSGANPLQIGNGSRLSAVSTNFAQGNLEATGSTFDFAIDGEGFFVLDSGNGPLYTRAGVFHVDQNGFLVDSATGYHVQRFGTVGEANVLDPAFQLIGDNSIQIPLGATVPGQPTTEAKITGNLSPFTTSDQQQILQSANPFLTGGSPAQLTTALNDLDSVSTGFQAGDMIEVDATDADGTSITAQIPVNGTTTLQNVVDALNAEFTGAQVSLTAAGNLELTANDGGVSMLSMTLEPAAGNTGQIDLSGKNFISKQLGLVGGVVRGGVEVYDERGEAHLLGVIFEKMSDGTWNMTAELDPSEGTVSDATVEGITFGPDGRIEAINGPDVHVTVQFVGQSESQTIQFDFGSGDAINGLTAIAGESSIGSSQDGYSAGSLVAISVEGNGLIEGIGSNGRRFAMAQMALASFRNPSGLAGEGNNLYSESNASGNVEFGMAGVGGRGRVVSGQLEASNVDIAIEFTRLIVAQRGFSANARTITITDEILEELTSLIR